MRTKRRARFWMIWADSRRRRLRVSKGDSSRAFMNSAVIIADSRRFRSSASRSSCSWSLRSLSASQRWRRSASSILASKASFAARAIASLRFRSSAFPPRRRRPRF